MCYTQNGKYAFFQHRDCEYFPCHTGIPEAEFNCLFCFCPLYALGPRCNGNYRYTEGGLKDCGQCTIPHRRKNYDLILKRFSEIAVLAARPVCQAGQAAELESTSKEQKRSQASKTDPL